MEDIKILLLNPDLQVIAKVSEIQGEDDTPYCFLLEVPMVLQFAPASTQEEPKISMSPLLPFSKSMAFRFPFDKVVTMGIPTDNILKRYVDIVKPYYPIDGGAVPNKVESKNQETND